MDRKNAIDPNLAVAYVLESPVSAAVIESTGVLEQVYKVCAGTQGRL